MGNVYFVDCENIGLNWFSMLGDLQKDDFLCVFSSQNAQPVQLKHIPDLLKYARQICFFECTTGSNALDFQLSTYLGFQIREKGSAYEYIILSNDKGYNAVCSFWEKEGFKVSRRSLKKEDLLKTTRQENQDIKEIQKVEKVKAVSHISAFNPKTVQQVDRVLKDVDQVYRFNETERGIIRGLLLESNVYDFEDLYKSFTRSFVPSKGRKYYKIFKPFIKKEFQISS